MTQPLRRILRFSGVLLALSVAFTSNAAPGKSAPKQAKPPVLAVTVQYARANLKFDGSVQRPGKSINVKPIVTNISSELQTFQTMGCSYGSQWKVIGSHASGDNYGVCYWNPSLTITLKPGESYQPAYGINVVIDNSDSKQKLPYPASFYLVFSPGNGHNYATDDIIVNIIK